MSFKISKNKKNRNTKMENFVLKNLFSRQANVIRDDKVQIKNKICKYGNRCNNEHCNSVHSLDEWFVPECEYGSSCKRKNGTMDYVRRELHTDKKCNKSHGETIEEYCERLNLSYYDLPERRIVYCQELFTGDE
jgi:hypothetical protein